MQSTICSICGKSAFDEVAAPAARPRRSGWDALDQGELRRLGAGVLTVALFAGAVVYWVTRPDPEVVATELPPPGPTVTVVDDPVPTAPDAPVGADAVLPTNAIIDPGAPREVAGDGLAPWETAPPVDFVTGLYLDEDIDYTVDIARVDELLAAFPALLDAAPLDPAEIQTLDGALDVELLETTQPFAARSLRRADNGTDVGELWLLASGGTEQGDAYLAAARARWNVDAAIGNFAGGAGLRIWTLAEGEDRTIWVTDLETDSLLVIQTPPAVSPELLTDTLRAWRRSLAAVEG